MVNYRILWRAFFVGTVLQVVLTIAAHFIPWVSGNSLLFGVMMISATVGYLYAQDYDKGYVAGALGGAIAGGACAAAGTLLAVVLQDATVPLLAFRTGVSILTGAVGGPFGQMSANLR